MALSRVKTWIAGEVLTAADLNSEFNNILNNPVSLISPLTGAVDFDGYTITLDAAAATTVNSTSAISWNFTSGAKAGTPATTGSVANWSAQTFTDSVTAGSGTATNWVGFAIQRPTLAATNSSVTTTNAATLYIPNAPAAGTNQTLTNPYAIWVDDGPVRFDGAINFNSPMLLSNVGIAASVAAKALTISLKTQSLTDPTAADPVYCAIRKYSVTSGSYDIWTVSSALSITIPSGATLGVGGGGTAYISVYLLNDNGTLRIGVYQDSASTATETNLVSFGAIGTGSDLAVTMYANAATGIICTARVIGEVTVLMGAVAGEWDNAPSTVYAGHDLFRSR